MKWKLVGFASVPRASVDPSDDKDNGYTAINTSGRIRPGRTRRTLRRKQASNCAEASSLRLKELREGAEHK